jgi:hypothetical protein
MTTSPTEPSSRPSLSVADRLRAWLVTGPLGRLVALLIEFAAALVRGVRRRR